MVDQVLAVQVQAVEQTQRERRSSGAPRRVARGDLERQRAPVGAERDRLAVEDDRAQRAARGRSRPARAAASVMSSRLRVKIETSPPRAWICTRMPSSFHSAAAVPRRSMAVAASAALPRRASARAAGRPRSGSPRAPARRPQRGGADDRRDRPRSISERRTAAAGTSAAFAIASTSTPASAPCRSSPAISARRNACSCAVARANSAVRAVRARRSSPGPQALRARRARHRRRRAPARARRRARAASRARGSRRRSAAAAARPMR